MSDSSRADLEDDASSVALAEEDDRVKSPETGLRDDAKELSPENEATPKPEDVTTANDAKEKNKSAGAKAHDVPARAETGDQSRSRRIVLEHFEMYKTESVRTLELEPGR